MTRLFIMSFLFDLESQLHSNKRSLLRILLLLEKEVQLIQAAVSLIKKD